MLSNLFVSCTNLISKVIYLYFYFDFKSNFILLKVHVFISFCHILMRVCSMHRFQKSRYLYSFLFLGEKCFLKLISLKNVFIICCLFMYLFIYLLSCRFVPHTNVISEVIILLYCIILCFFVMHASSSHKSDFRKISNWIIHRSNCYYDDLYISCIYFVIHVWNDVIGE